MNILRLVNLISIYLASFVRTYNYQLRLVIPTVIPLEQQSLFLTRVSLKQATLTSR
jgi:hypothetical protein